MKHFVLPGLVVITLLWCESSSAQNASLELRYVSERGAQAVTLFDYERTRVPDADGDGQADIVMTRRNALGYLDGVLAIDGATSEELFRMEVETEDEFAGLEFVGFVDLFGAAPGEPRPALFAGESSFRLEFFGFAPLKPAEVWGDGSISYRLTGIADYDGDGRDEIAAYVRETEQIEVWGAP